MWKCTIIRSLSQKWNHFWVKQDPCSSRQGLFWWKTVHYPCMFMVIFMHICSLVSPCVFELLFHIWMEATSNRDLTLRCVSCTQQQHKLFSWSLWAFRCEELLLHAFSLTGSFREKIWASGFLSTSLLGWLQ